MNFGWLQRSMQWAIAHKVHWHLLFFVLVGLRVYVVLNHEVWRDDVQPLNVANQATSFWNLLDAARYERSHALWPVIMYGLHQVGLGTVLGMQVTYLSFSILTLAILIYGLPRIPFAIKLLLGSSYWLMFEYTALPRPYGTTVLLLAIFVMLEMRWPKKVLWKALTLFLMAFSNIFGMVIAVALAAYTFWNMPKERAKLGRALLVGIIVVGVALSILSAWPPPDIYEIEAIQQYRAGVFANFGIPRAMYASSHIVTDGFAYIPPILTKYGWWNQVSMTRDWIPLNSRLDNIIGILGILLAAFGVWRFCKVNVGLGAAAGILWFGFIGALSYGHWGDIWHLGLVFLGTLALLALAGIQKRKVSLKAPIEILLYVLLMISTLAGLGAVYSDGQHVFGQGTNVVKWLEANAPDEVPIIYPAAWGQVYAASTGRPYYVLEGEKEMFAMRSDTSLLKPVSPLLVDKMELPPEGRILITSKFPFPVQNIQGKFRIEPLASFSPSLEWTESFWVYRVYPISDSEDNKSSTWKMKFSPTIAGSGGAVTTMYEQNSLVYIKTSADQESLFTWDDQSINNEVGTTAEVRLRIVKGPTTGKLGMIFSIEDGIREGKVSFFDHHIEMLDQNEVRVVYWMDTGEDLHTYRLTLVKDRLELYVDGERIAVTTLTSERNLAVGKIVLGDIGNRTGENVLAEIEYLAYSPGGAFAPNVEVSHE